MTTTHALILLDTSVLVHLFRNDDIGQKVAADNSLLERSEKPLISIVTVGEALAIAEKNGWGKPKKDRLTVLLTQLVVVDINSLNVLVKYATIDAWCKSNGKCLGKNDLWIAATASAVGAHLLTCDQDYAPLDPLFLTQTYYAP